MSLENHLFDRKRIDALDDVKELAKDCVAFANAEGGVLHIGIEDKETLPPPNQKIKEKKIVELSQKIDGNTINVSILPAKITAENGGEFIELKIFRSQSIAATSDGRYFLRVADASRPLMPDEISRLLTEKTAHNWEEQTSRNVSANFTDEKKRVQFLTDIRTSERVKTFVKEKSDDEILEHYRFIKDGLLTNLGILWIGQNSDRAMLQHAPVVQFIKKDEFENKVNKIVWDDFLLNPKELIDSIWNEIPDWREFYELPDGIFRKQIPHYDERIIRELLANALVHRPYTQRGDIFINLFPDRLEIHNPGLLPLGVTPENILHKSVKRNEHLAKVFHDLKLMEREGSGFDLIYDVLLSNGKPLPKVQEGDDRVVVTIYKRIVNKPIIDFVKKADETFQLKQKERITLGLVAQNESLTAKEMTKILELNDVSELKHWLGSLVENGLIKTKGRTKGTEYFVESSLLKKLDFKGKTSLKGIESHRLRELILRDLEIYEEAGISEIHQRIGLEIPRRKIEYELKRMVENDEIKAKGEKKHRKYLFAKHSQ
ncbi:MAG TPA: ATP-binding protein [Pyrinomonadaceae bacterium]|nr:ATP-binding protein [Pyrinomonadaceae bacterium]